MIFFDFIPTKKDGPVQEFFSTWTPFCNDFKTIWRNEQQRLLKEKLKEAEKIVKQKRSLLSNIIVKKPRASMGLVSLICNFCILLQNSKMHFNFAEREIIKKEKGIVQRLTRMDTQYSSLLLIITYYFTSFNYLSGRKVRKKLLLKPTSV